MLGCLRAGGDGTQPTDRQSVKQIRPTQVARPVGNGRVLSAHRRGDGCTQLSVTST